MRPILTLFCWVMLIGHSSASPAPFQQPTQRTGVPNYCEPNRARLEVIDGEAGRQALVIVIARLGSGERSSAWNHRRVHNVRVFLETFLGRDPKTIVTAHGERVKGKGVVELYVGGALVGTFHVGRMEDLYLGTCEDRDPEDKLLFDSR